jgi:hypothetical protein
MMRDLWSQFMFLIIGGGVLYAIWSASRPRWDVHIVVRDGTVLFRKGVSQSRWAAFETFLLNDVKLVSVTEVFARRENNGRLVTHFKGQLDAGTKQQIRNFLISAV